MSFLGGTEKQRFFIILKQKTLLHIHEFSFVNLIFVMNYQQNILENINIRKSERRYR